MQKYEQKPDILGDRNSYSKTDPDATFMRMKEDAMNNRQTKPGYNLQIGTKRQYIANFGLFSNPGDTLTLIPLLTLNMARLNKLPQVLCADSGYDSEENYHMLQRNNIEAFVKYNYSHKEQKRSFKNDAFRQENFYYTRQKDYVVCPIGQHMRYIGDKVVVNENGFKSTVKRYQAVNCQGCPLRGGCTKAKGNRIREISYRLVAYKKKASDTERNAP